MRDEAFYAESETDRRRRTASSSRRPTGAEVEWVEEPSAISSGCRPGRSRLLGVLRRAIPTSSRRESRRNEVISFVEGRPAGPVGLAHQLLAGASRCRAIPRTSCMSGSTRSPTTSPQCGYPDTEQSDCANVLAGRPAHGRQGHPALPRGLLAGLPDGGRAGAAAARLRARLVDQRGPEDLEVARQRHRPAGAGRAPTGSTRCATSCCARCRSATTATSRTAPWSAGMNGDLANDYGNLGQRVLSIIGQELRRQGAGRARSPRPTRRCSTAPGRCWASCAAELDDQAFHRALTSIWEVIADANRYVDAQAPWALRKTDPARMRHGALGAGRDDPARGAPGAALHARTRRASCSISSPCRPRSGRSPPSTARSCRARRCRRRRASSRASSSLRRPRR